MTELDQVYAWSGPYTRRELRQHLLSTVGTFLIEEPWIGVGAELAAADAILSYLDWLLKPEIE